VVVDSRPVERRRPHLQRRSLLESVDAYRQLWDRWVRDDGFRVTGYVSSAVRVQVLGDAR